MNRHVQLKHVLTKVLPLRLERDELIRVESLRAADFIYPGSHTSTKPR
jgi:hypothetical protein